MSTKLIQSPPCTPEMEAKLVHFLKTMSEFMGVEIACSTRRVMVIEVGEENKAAITMITNILKRLSNGNSAAPKPSEAKSLDSSVIEAKPHA